MLLALAPCGCRSAQPRFEYATPTGVARSDDEHVARAIAEIADSFSAPVAREMEVDQPPPFVIHHVHHVPTPFGGGVWVVRDRAGRVVDRHIVISNLGLMQARFAIAHELVHWYASRTWDRLPHAVEEGLADSIALKLAPEWKQIRELELDLRLNEITPERRALALQVTERQWEAAPTQVREDAYAVGFEIVQRLGVARLRALCVMAEAAGLDRVPVPWLMCTVEPPTE